MATKHPRTGGSAQRTARRTVLAALGGGLALGAPGLLTACTTTAPGNGSGQYGTGPTRGTEARKGEALMLDETLLAAITANTGNPRRPLLFSNTTVHTADPAIGDPTDADLLLAGDVIVGLGPDLHATVVEDDPIVIDGTGLLVVPWIVDGGADSGPHAHRADRVGVLRPGSPATFAVIAERSSGSALEMIVWRPEQAGAIIVDGEVAFFNGSPLTPTPIEPVRTQPLRNPYLGTWTDESGYVHQELTADGRYDETRGGRPHAYQGSFWIEGDWIVYRDDLGFWAYGRFGDGVLHHAGYTFHRR